MIALPFAKITSTDSELRERCGGAGKTCRVARAAVSSGDAARTALSSKAAQELADRISSRD